MRKKGHRTGEYRSKLESRVASQLGSLGLEISYETDKIKFIQPAKQRTYTPDFKIQTASGNTVYLEVKGILDLGDRQKHEQIREYYISLKMVPPDIRFIFGNPRAKISPKSKTTYGDWCTKKGFQYCHVDDARKTIERWLKE